MIVGDRTRKLHPVAIRNVSWSNSGPQRPPELLQAIRQMHASAPAGKDVEVRQAGLVMVRYADDAVVLCRTLEEAGSCH